MIQGRQLSRKAVAKSVTIAAPTGGLNGKDSIANMPTQDAYILDNWFPNATSVVQRNGKKAWATGIPAAVNTLAIYNGASTSKMFAACAAKIYDVTATGAVGAAVVTGLASDKFQWCQMGTIGGRFLCMFNGVDNGQYFDGASWISVSMGAGATQIANVNPTNIISCNIYKSRMYLLEKNTANVWYLPLNAIYGAATKLDLSSLLSRGANIIAMATWTIDNSAGLQEYAVFLSSDGDVLVYEGADPSTSSFTLAARFSVGRPAGYRCFEKIGSDLAVIGADGIFPLSKALVTDRSQEKYALTDKIVTLVSADFQSYANNFGWQIIIYPIGNKLILNVPTVAGTTSYQYVMNTITNAWCRFTGWNAFCWATQNDKLFYGGYGAVYQADTTTSDDGINIVADAQQAFQYFGVPTKKVFNMIRPVIVSTASVSPSIIMNVDFDIQKPLDTSTFTDFTTTLWGSPWLSPWSTELRVNKDWQTCTGIGIAGGVRLLVASNKANVSWSSTDIIFETGNVL